MPSVGIDPPTPKPRPNMARQSQPKVGAHPASKPKKEVRRRVPLKAAVRPKLSESARRQGPLTE